MTNEDVAKFIIKNLPTIIVELEYESLNENFQALYANASTIYGNYWIINLFSP